VRTRDEIKEEIHALRNVQKFLDSTTDDDNNHIIVWYESRAVKLFRDLLGGASGEKTFLDLFDERSVVGIANCLKTDFMDHACLMPKQTLNALPRMREMSIERPNIALAVLWCWTSLSSHCLHWHNAGADLSHVFGLLAVCNSALGHMSEVLSGRVEDKWSLELLKNRARAGKVVSMAAEAMIAAAYSIETMKPGVDVEMCVGEICAMARQTITNAIYTGMLTPDTAYTFFRQSYKLHLHEGVHPAALQPLLHTWVKMKPFLMACVSMPHACYEEEFQVIPIVTEVAKRLGGLDKESSAMAVQCLFAFANRPAGYAGLVDGLVPPPCVEPPTLDSCTGCSFKKLWVDVFRWAAVAHPDEVAKVMSGFLGGLYRHPDFQQEYLEVGKAEWLAGPELLVGALKGYKTFDDTTSPHFHEFVQKLTDVFFAGVKWAVSTGNTEFAADHPFNVTERAMCWKDLKDTCFFLGWFNFTLIPRLKALYKYFEALALYPTYKYNRDGFVFVNTCPTGRPGEYQCPSSGVITCVEKLNCMLLRCSEPSWWRQEGLMVHGSTV